MNKEVWMNPRLEASLDEAETPLWFWNAQLETEELVRQLKLQTDIGVKATNPHARTENGVGYKGGYLDEEWFGHLQTVLDYKKKHGEKMWLYDEIDWPAGTCNKTITREEAYREQYVTVERVLIPAGTVYRAQLHTFEGAGMFGMTAETDYSQIPLNITIIDAETEEAYDLTAYFDYQIFGPELEFQADRDAIAFLTQIRVDPYDKGGDESVSYINAEATRAFLRSTYDLYYEKMGEDFGDTITTVFNDETRMCHALVWSDEFAEAFRSRHGYDIRREFYRLILPGDGHGHVRVDYYDTVAHLYQTNYFKILYDWCQAHRLKFFAHLLAEETPFGHVRYSGDYMRQNRYQDVVGADYLGKGIGSLNLKFTSAAAHSYGKNRTAVEIFAGCGWDLTFDEYTRMITFAYQQGMQIIINHGFFYSAEGERANDWPPSEFFQWKYWHRQTEGNEMIRRLQYAMTGGVNEMGILAYMPTETMQFHLIPDQTFTHAFAKGAFLRDGQAVRVDRELQLLFNSLLSHNLDFDLVHRDACENFVVREGVICNTKSGQTFQTLVLPFCEVLPLEMAMLAEEFASAGGRILLVDDLPGRGCRQEETAEVEAIFRRLLEGGHVRLLKAEEREDICGLLEGGISHPIQIAGGRAGTENFHPAYPPYLIDPYMHTGEEMTGVHFVRYCKDGKRNTLFMNYGDREETVEVRVETCGPTPEIWDSLTGEIRTAEVLEAGEGWIRIRMTLPTCHGVFVVSEL